MGHVRVLRRTARYIHIVTIHLHQWSDYNGDQCPTPNNTHVANWYEYTMQVASLAHI